MKIVFCLLFVVILNCSRSVRCSNVVQYHDEPTSGIKISKNVTIKRRGYGRHLGLLSLLKGIPWKIGQSLISSKFEGNLSDIHHRKRISNPYVMSKLWRASFEFELKPREMYGHEFAPGIYFPSGTGSSNIDTSIFHLGNNEQLQVRIYWMK